MLSHSGNVHRTPLSFRDCNGALSSWRLLPAGFRSSGAIPLHWLSPLFTQAPVSSLLTFAPLPLLSPQLWPPLAATRCRPKGNPKLLVLLLVLPPPPPNSPTGGGCTCRVSVATAGAEASCRLTRRSFRYRQSVACTGEVTNKTRGSQSQSARNGVACNNDSRTGACTHQLTGAGIVTAYSAARTKCSCMNTRTSSSELPCTLSSLLSRASWGGPALLSGTSEV